MDKELRLQRLAEKVDPVVLTGIALTVLLCGYAVHRRIGRHLHELQADLQSLTQAQAQSALALSHYESLAELKANDVDQFKRGMVDLAQSKKALFEAGLSSQEERRLLEKQWEIITTYLNVDIGLGRIFLMRGDQPLESYLIDYVPMKALGGVPAKVPRFVHITSKERFANPERGTSELVNGKLQWVPPQVGTSVRSNALGEYVMFTNSKLILHGPPLNLIDHDAYPHLCVGLSREAARNLYQHSFIGTKILLANVKEELARQQAASSFSVNIATAATKPHGY
jgi:hypothetical protein